MDRVVLLFDRVLKNAVHFIHARDYAVSVRSQNLRNVGSGRESWESHMRHPWKEGSNTRHCFRYAGSSLHMTNVADNATRSFDRFPPATFCPSVFQEYTRSPDTHEAISCCQWSGTGALLNRQPLRFADHLAAFSETCETINRQDEST